MPRRHRSDYAGRRGEEGWYEVSSLTDDEPRPWVFTSHTAAAKSGREPGHMPLILPRRSARHPARLVGLARSETGFQQARRVALTTSWPLQ
jgi:hypothetical protein